MPRARRLPTLTNRIHGPQAPRRDSTAWHAHMGRFTHPQSHTQIHTDPETHKALKIGSVACVLSLSSDTKHPGIRSCPSPMRKEIIMRCWHRFLSPRSRETNKRPSSLLTTTRDTEAFSTKSWTTKLSLNRASAPSLCCLSILLPQGGKTTMCSSQCASGQKRGRKLRGRQPHPGALAITWRRLVLTGWSPSGLQAPCSS